ncbi:hypothetical protein IFR04_002615 [Cadophora malorum]|uniref:Hard-surface induced protein 5 n=1 Tax=Cadophora malorum TaxID=108018 RepID=A0A8H7WFZ8_9HELO|nr:hypothetical protein IFR04_002615 [Cadophora malorum]
MPLRMGLCMLVTSSLAILALIVTLWQSSETVLSQVKKVLPPNRSGEEFPDRTTSQKVNDRPSFLDIALKHGTDKVTTHHYNYMYDKYLEPLRDQRIKVLEIGLGCNMGYGPGAPYHTWLEYFTNVDLYFIEYDAACAEKWKAETTGATIFTGDQADAAFLDRFLSETGGNFDIMIDDGGHTMQQQMTSLETLFKAVVPGGIYFCEDLATSYEEQYGGGDGKTTMMGMIKELLDDLNHAVEGRPDVKHQVGSEMRSIECGEQICAFFKEDSR